MCTSLSPGRRTMPASRERKRDASARRPRDVDARERDAPGIDERSAEPVIAMSCVSTTSRDSPKFLGGVRVLAGVAARRLRQWTARAAKRRLELRLRSVRLSVRSLSAVNSPEFTTEIEFIGFLNATRSTRADLFESNFDRDSRSQRKTKRGGVAGGAGDAPARERTEKTRKESLSLDEFIDRAAIRTTVLLHHRPHPLPPSRLNPPLFFAFFSLCAR
jgi:hypothetical protein